MIPEERIQDLEKQLAELANYCIAMNNALGIITKTNIGMVRTFKVLCSDYVLRRSTAENRDPIEITRELNALIDPDGENSHLRME